MKQRSRKRRMSRVRWVSCGTCDRIRVRRFLIRYWGAPRD